MSNNGFTFILNKIASFLDPEQIFSDLFRSVDPKRWIDEWGQPDTVDEDLPEHLMLRIADKEDAKKIEEFFNSRTKDDADPNSFVKSRSNDEVIKTTNRGSIVLIEDHNHDIVSICFGFTHKVEEMPEHEGTRMVSEMGTVISSIKGLGLPSITISALSLLIQDREGEDHPLIAKVSKENESANGLFSKSLKWKTTDNKDIIKSLFNSSMGDTMRENDETKANVSDIADTRNWYYFCGNASDHARELIQEIFDNGYIIKNDKEILFEFDKDDFSFELELEEEKKSNDLCELDSVFEETDETNPITPILETDNLIDEGVNDIEKHQEDMEVIEEIIENSNKIDLEPD